jgi:L-ascorbate metabolism protein UlaG (beta-lactamase superfamily)
MSATMIAIYVLLIGFVLYKRITPQPVGSPKKLLLLPALLTVIGVTNLSHAHLDHVDVAVTVVAAIVSVVGGATRGAVDTFDTRNGFLSVRWGAAALIALVATLAARVMIDGVGVAAGGTWAGSSQSLLFTLGLTLLAEAGVILLRALSSGVPLAPSEVTNGRRR